MSAAIVVLESLNQFVVNASSARDLVNDAAITNIKGQGAVSGATRRSRVV